MILLSVLLASAQAETRGAIGIGMSKRLGDLSNWLQPGTTIRPQLLFDVGSLSVGPLLQLDIHNGVFYDAQAEMGCIDMGTCIQGDSYIVSTGVHAQSKTDFGKKWRMVSHADLAIRKMPLLMDSQYYSTEVVQSWNGYKPAVHENLLPGAAGGIGMLRQRREDGPWVGASIFACYDLGLSPAAGLLVQVQSN
jgi:hypothetical protein